MSVDMLPEEMTSGAVLDRAIGLERARERLKMPGGGLPSMGAMWKWVNKGCRLPSGDVVRLKAFKWGRNWVTLPEWVEEFKRQQLEAALAQVA